MDRLLPAAAFRPLDTRLGADDLGDMLTTVVAWLLLVSFLVLQRVMRRGEPARSLQAPPADRGSTRLLGAAFGCS